ncbi:preprotein translocase subunit YajC [Selenomonas sputigena]|uniref:Preprotein translocase subunit YajC n=1 Tax=Selenomonas sputigena TaxID=69823 RepID=A0ABV3X2W9_9FIRM
MDANMMNVFYTYGPLVFMVLVIYFLIIKPQRKEQKRRKEMLDGLKRGNRVVTIGGIFGVLTEVRDTTVKLKIAEHVEIEVSRASINANVSAEERSEKE